MNLTLGSPGRGPRGLYIIQYSALFVRIQGTLLLVIGPDAIVLLLRIWFVLSHRIANHVTDWVFLLALTRILKAQLGNQLSNTNRIVSGLLFTGLTPNSI